MRFAQPLYLLLLLIIPFLIWYYFKRGKATASKISYSGFAALKKNWSRPNIDPKNILLALRLVVLVLIIIALARPQAGQKGEDVSSRGIDIMLVLDTSTSMKAEDFQPYNRLYAAKQVARDFIKGRKHDRIGIVVFAALSFTQAPLSLDYGALLDLLGKVEIGMAREDGTAIGNALVTAVNRLKNTQAKSKIIIILTDGRNNRGEIDPVSAANVAQAMGIKIYTIGAGKPGGALYLEEDPFFGKRYVKREEDLDEGILKQIAGLTGGTYFRATDTKSLVNIFKEIDKMEKVEIKVKEYTEYNELFYYLLWPAFLLFGLELLLANTIFKRIP